MIGIISSKIDIASSNMALHILEKGGFEQQSAFNGIECWNNDNATLILVEGSLVEAEIDSFGFEVAYFLSKHKSADQVPALTVHSLGNWGKDAKLGGKPKELTFAAPEQMLGMLQKIERIDFQIQKSYEATHHGPLLKTPSFFVELGGDQATIENKKLASILADAVHDQIMKDKRSEHSKIVIGVGSTHYPSKFNRLALEKGYAFSHIMPKYAILNSDGTDNLEMLGQALGRSKITPEIALVDWKSINADTKNKVVGELNRLGLDHERV